MIQIERGPRGGPGRARQGPSLVGIAGMGVGLLVLGCSGAEPSSPSSPLGEDVTSSADSVSSEIAVPRRLASVAILGDELLWTLSPESRAATVAVSPLADDPRYSQAIGVWPEGVRRLSKNPAALLAADPDLAIVATFTDPQYRAAIAKVVPILELNDFTGFEGYEGNVTRLALALGQVEAGERLRAEFRRKIAAIEAKRPPGRGPTCLAWAHGSVSGAATTFHAATVAAGCVNVPAQAGLEGHHRVDAEQIVAWDPDFIVVSCGVEDRCERAATQFGTRPGFAALRAVKQGQVIPISAPLLSTTGAAMAELAERIQTGLLASRASVQVPDGSAFASVSESTSESARPRRDGLNE